MKAYLDPQEVSNELDAIRMKLYVLIEDEDHQGYFQDGKDGSSLCEGLTGVFDDMTKMIAETGKSPKGCCSDVEKRKGDEGHDDVFDTTHEGGNNS